MRNILCFGDSNTWGYNPANGERFPEDVRWAGRLKSSLKNIGINVIEEGLCGRTTIYEDETRPDRRGIDSIRPVFARNQAIDTVILMLGTNDCKTYNKSNAREIAGGVEQVLDKILKYVKPENVLLISPIHLGENVWKDEYDPEFNANSVKVSKELKQEYLKVARRHHVNFLAASDYVVPSETDQEHLDAESHRIFSQIIYDRIIKMNVRCA